MTGYYDLVTAYYDLGSYRRALSTKSPEAQLWFDRGLIWCYGYNHEEAVRCFQRTAAADPDCALAHWGIAYAAGPNYNKQWKAFDTVDLKRSLALAYGATSRAMACLDHASPIAMREVYRAHSDDLDVASLFAEAIMNRTPWQLWDLRSGGPAEGADTLEAIRVLETAMAAPGGTSHPGLLHMYIHLMEMSPHPERAMPAADRLRNLVPDAGHLLHMPTHIDVLCGNYWNVVEGNSRAIAADHKFLQREGAINFYTLYRCHNYHFKLYGAMFLGQYAPALAAANQMIEALPEDLPALFCVTTAMQHYAKAVAQAASGNLPAAEDEARNFEASVGKVPPSRYVFNNTCLDILSVAGEMMRGEIEYRRGNHDVAFAHLRKSVELDDNLPYDEPWGWMQPTRHALGALLLEQGRVEEAESVYRADLGLDGTLSRACQHPENAWSLHGLHECLLRLGKKSEAEMIKHRLDLAAARADVPIQSSCFCRLGTAA